MYMYTHTHVYKFLNTYRIYVVFLNMPTFKLGAFLVDSKTCSFIVLNTEKIKVRR